jgi:predicted DNA-binding ribbon-helix-helix protein
MDPPARLPAKTTYIDGHPASFRLEPELWRALRRAATEQGMSAREFIERVSRNRRRDRSLASELRVAVCGHFEASAPELGFFDPHSRLAIRLVRRRKPAGAKGLFGS